MARRVHNSKNEPLHEVGRLRLPMSATQLQQALGALDRPGAQVRLYGQALLVEAPEASLFDGKLVGSDRHAEDTPTL